MNNHAVKKMDNGLETSSSFFSCVIIFGNFNVNLKSTGVLSFQALTANLDGIL